MDDSMRPDFSNLDRFLAVWGLPTVQQRREKRLASTFEELKTFHDAMMPRLAEIVEFLDRFPLAAIPDEYKRLSYAALAMCEVDDPVSKWRSVLLDEALDPRRFTVKASFYDTAHSIGRAEDQS